MTVRNLAGVIDQPHAGAPDRRVLGWVVAAFLGGLLIGMIALVGYALVAGAA